MGAARASFRREGEESRQGGVKVDGAVIGDKALQIGAGTFVLQVGKRKFARVTFSA